MTINSPSLMQHPIIHQLLNARGFSKKEIYDLFSWDLKEIPNLTKLNDLDKASSRIIQAINLKEKIAIYGDYDVDGCTSCALFYHFFKLLDIEVTLYQPNRFQEGYGLHNSSIDKAVEDSINLLITVDCGITNNQAASHALVKKIDLIITDHHNDISEELPKAFAVVNPNRRDENCDSSLKFLAGVGVAFSVCIKIKNDLKIKGVTLPSIYPLLTFVAIGSLCDMVKLTNLNLKLIRHGLKLLSKKQFKGLSTFFKNDDYKQKIIPSEKITFNVGPLINSKGRIGKPDIALKLLVSSNIIEAKELYQNLIESNNERKIIQGQVFKEAFEKIFKYIKKNKYQNKLKISIVYNSEWHEGVIGIVASKLVETFKVPAIVITNSKEKGILKGSTRTAGDLNIFALLSDCSDLFIKFGGHKAAAGFSMKKENLREFNDRMNNFLENIPCHKRTVIDYYDLDIDFNQITPGLLKELEKLEPFGNGNEAPVFISSNCKLESFQILKEVHISWVFSSIENPNKKLKGISFNYLNKIDLIHPNKLLKIQEARPLTIKYKLKNDFWNGMSFLKLYIEQIY